MKMHKNISKRYISFCSCTLFAHTPLIFNVMVTRKYTFVLFCSHTHSKKRYTRKKTKYAESYFQKRAEKEKDLHNNKKKRTKRVRTTTDIWHRCVLFVVVIVR